MMDLPPPFDAVWFRFLAGFIVGSAIGSFATMLAYRVPRGISIITPRSHCPTCKSTLGARDLVPLLSWLTSGGHCRHCNAKIGNQYLWIELTISVLFGLLAVALGFIK
jgi:prepilin signal peptidase PulO-like enzyme (type II secretory pathway)